MNYNSTTDKNVYIDIDTLTGWSNQINEINENSIERLKSLTQEIDNLNNYWEGNFATGFINETTELVESAELCHNDMKSLSSFLMNVIDTKSNQ